LREAGIETPELDARLLLCHAAALSHEAYIARSREALQPETSARLDAAIARRLKHEPVSRITGSREFYGRSFQVDAYVLDPRPDTETLIEAALGIVKRQRWHDKPLRLLDLGTGTGCILLTLLAELPRARGVGIDKSQAARACASANARRLGVDDRARLIAADWLDGIEGRFDLILSNPPYLPSCDIPGLAPDVAGYDPILALDGGADGLDAYRHVAARAPRALAEDGRLVLEIGATQAEAVQKILCEAVLRPQALRRDLAGRPRVVVAAREPALGAKRRKAKIPLGKPPCSD
jgi:release factor glutamine methyltransferase